LSLGHGGNGWIFTAKGGGWEPPLVWAVGCFALSLPRWLSAASVV